MSQYIFTHTFNIPYSAIINSYNKRFDHQNHKIIRYLKNIDIINDSESETTRKLHLEIDDIPTYLGYITGNICIISHKIIHEENRLNIKIENETLSNVFSINEFCYFEKIDENRTKFTANLSSKMKTNVYGKNMIEDFAMSKYKSFYDSGEFVEQIMKYINI